MKLTLFIDTLVINEDNHYVDILNNSKNKIIWSVNYYNRKLPKSRYLNSKIVSQKNNFIGVILETKSIKIFNNEKILIDFSLNE